jgi:hypothetical protein
MHPKVFVKLIKPKKHSRPGKKTQKNPKNPKNSKKPTGLGILKKTRVFSNPAKNGLYIIIIVADNVLTSVADPGCLSRIPDPDFYPSRIPDPGSRIPDLGSRISDPGSQIPDLGSRVSDPKTATKERDEKKFFVRPFYVATNFTKLKIILVLKC